MEKKDIDKTKTMGVTSKFFKVHTGAVWIFSPYLVTIKCGLNGKMFQTVSQSTGQNVINDTDKKTNKKNISIV